MNKKLKTVIAGAIAAAGIAMAAPASAEQYINAQIGVSDIGSYTGYHAYSFDNGLSLIGTWGMTIPAVHKYFGIEVEGSKSIVNPEYTSDSWGWFGWTPYKAEYSYWTAGAYAVFAIPINEKLTVRARGGAVYNNWKITTNDYNCGYFFNQACSYSSSDINPSVGGGVTYALNSNVNLMAEVTAFDISNDYFHVSAGAQFKF